jgi:hypothetical protein
MAEKADEKTGNHPADNSLKIFQNIMEKLS